MLPEIPHPFEGKLTGFPITAQFFTDDYDNNIEIASADILGPKNKKLPFYTLSPKSKGEAGDWAKLLKLIAIATTELLEPYQTYKVKLKAKDLKNNIF